MTRIIAWTCLLLGLGLLFGCNHSSAPPAGPTTPAFTMDAQPPSISPPEQAQIYLRPAFIAEFNSLQGLQVIFSSSSDSGVFNPLFTYLDTAAFSGLNPEVWYLYTGSSSNLVDTLYAYCVAPGGQTVAWNYCTIQITGNR